MKKFLSLRMVARLALAMLLAGVLLAVLSAVTAHAATLSDKPNPATWVTDGSVRAIVRTPSTVYLGGDFTWVGPPNGYGLPLSATTGQPTSTFPMLNGSVQACAPDGTGGWYIGGNFSRVGSLAQNRLAHILADGRVDAAWNPNPSGIFPQINALAVSNGTVYVGGFFGSIGGQVRNNIAALDATTGMATPWNPGASSYVYTLTVSSGTVYAGGDFWNIGGQARNRIAALDATTGAATTWKPEANGSINALAVSGGIVYAGGQFTNIGGQARNRIAALDAASTGTVTAWNPSANGQVSALTVSGEKVYAGGLFTSIGGQTRNRIAALDAASGTATAWDPNANNSVLALTVANGTVYAGGYFNSIGGQVRNYLAALDAANGTATAWNPNPNGYVQALAISDGMVYVGGNFGRISGQTRNHIAALDATSGTATAWNPNANGSVRALAVAGGTVYASGDFTIIGGQTRNSIAALNATSGTATAWDPNANGIVSTLAISDGTIYAGGAFSIIGGQVRNNIAALDAANGAATAWNPDANGYVRTLAVSNGTVYAGGDFTYIGGRTRSHIAALNTINGAATTWWNPSANGSVYALAVSGGTIYAQGGFSYIGSQPRFSIAALEAASGAATAWNPNFTGTVANIGVLTLSGGTLYVGGGFNVSIGGPTRNSIAALDAASAAVMAWNPNAGGYVYALAVSGGTVYAGGNFSTIGGQTQPYFAQFDTPADAPTRPGVTGLQPDRLTWTWDDKSNNEDGFKVWADPGQAMPTTRRTTTAAEATSWTYSDLTPNTKYAFQVAATNAWGDSAKTSVFTTFTLAAAPTAGQNLLASQVPGEPQPLGTAFIFSNPAGFGVGSHGGGAWGVSGFRWTWDTSTAHAFNGSESVWNAGALTQTAVNAGRYYLHLQSINAAGLVNPVTLDLGPFVAGAPPKIITQPTGRTVNPGSAVSFSVTTSGTTPMTYQWKKNGVSLVGAKSATLTVSNADYSDAGFYTCVVDNPAGTTTSKAARMVVNPMLTVVSARGTPSPAAGTTVYTTGTQVTAKVTAATVNDPADPKGTTRWVCTGWTATGAAPASGSASSVSFKLTQPTTITWQWKTQYKLTATADPASRGSVKLADGVTAANGTWHDDGQKLTLRAMPTAGNRFAFWWGKLSGRTNPGSLTLGGPTTVGARFDRSSNGVTGWTVYGE